MNNLTTFPTIATFSTIAIDVNTTISGLATSIASNFNETTSNETTSTLVPSLTTEQSQQVFELHKHDHTTELIVLGSLQIASLLVIILTYYLVLRWTTYDDHARSNHRKYRLAHPRKMAGPKQVDHWKHQEHSKSAHMKQVNQKRSVNQQHSGHKEPHPNAKQNSKSRSNSKQRKLRESGHSHSKNIKH